MQRGYLVSMATGSRVALKKSTVIGRAPGCDIVINDRAASRRHLEVTVEGGAFAWKDLGSANGTSLNGRRMIAGELSHGDVITIGETGLRFEAEASDEEPGPPPKAREAPPPLSDTASSAKTSPPKLEIVQGAPREGAIFQEAILDGESAKEASPEAKRSTALLEAVYSVVNEISRNYEPCSLIDRILETTVRATNAQRAALFLAGNDNALLPCPVCNKIHRIKDGKLLHAEEGEIQITRTVVNRVIQGGESVLYQDTDEHQEFNTAESIMSLALRSVICVPLRAKDDILGVLYMDTDRSNQRFGREDLLLAAAVGNSAGLALQNARMHQEMLEKQRMEQEIATAWTIQEGFLVKEWPQNSTVYEVYGETRPAKTVGGDFYDFVQPAKDVVGVLIGDVSGKGVPASLTMAQLLAEFRLHARDLESPAEVLAALNAGLVKRSRHGLFCTLSYLRIDLKTGEVIAANAGHSPALRIGWSGAVPFDAASGPPLGILPTAEWEDTYARLEKGDSLLLFTDGITEARRKPADSPLPEEFGQDALERTAASHYGLEARALITAIQREIQQFCAPQAPHDDCTMIAVRYIGH